MRRRFWSVFMEGASALWNNRRENWNFTFSNIFFPSALFSQMFCRRRKRVPGSGTIHGSLKNLNFTQTPSSLLVNLEIKLYLPFFFLSVDVTDGVFYFRRVN